MTEINWHSTHKEIENMTIKQAMEIIKGQIDLGHTKGDCRPREHMTKALEMAYECMDKVNRQSK